MQHFFKQIYTLWCAIVFVGLFLLLFPLYWLITLKESWNKHCYYLNKIWANLALFMVGINVELEGRQYLDVDSQYVYCANHFSLMDIVSFGFAPHSIVYVGKSSLAKIPLFGYMFRKLHVTVNRASVKDAYRALNNALAKMAEGRSLVMYPEGGILSKKIPEMTRFKEGAFRAAILKQIPLVPVTLPDNWIILPDQKIPSLERRRMRIIYHRPIPTEGMTIEDVPRLKEEVYQIISNELEIRLKDEH